MAFSRYERCPIIDFNRQYGTNTAHVVIRKGIADGTITSTSFLLHEKERLDHIAGRTYGNSRYWWIIAAASGIGWGLQVPPGTVIVVPNLEDVARLVG